MSIRFNCPHCEKTLKVPTEHAGKRARCPGCKKSVSIPALDPVVTAEMEELAAAALSEDVQSAETRAEKVVGTIKFECYYCDEAIEVSADLAGMQTPCPECRKIVKVPLPAKKEPLDWRKVSARGPAAGMRRDEPPAPEGAWGSTNTSNVSARTIIEATGIEKPPLTAKQWIKRGTLITVGLIAVGAGAWLFMHFRGQSLKNKALNLALESVPEKGASSLDNLGTVEIHRALGEFFIREGRAADAKNHLAKAQSALREEMSAPKSPADVEAAAIDLALTQVELFGPQEQAQAGRRLAWADAPKETRNTLKAISSPEARAEAVRQLTRKLLGTGQLDAVKGLIETMALLLSAETDRAEMLGIAGLEYLRAGHRPEAEALAAKALSAFDPTMEPKPAAAPTLAGLLIAIGQERTVENTLKLAAPRSDTGGASADARLAYALGWACTGKLEQALQLANAPGPALERWNALVAVATCQPGSETDAATKAMPLATTVFEKDMQGRVPEPWSLARLVNVANRIGQADAVRPLVNVVTDPAIRQRAEMELIRGPAAATWDVNALNSAIKENPQPALAELRARLAAKNSSAADVLSAVQSWEPETLRPFGYIAVALGLQDAGQ